MVIDEKAAPAVASDPELRTVLGRLRDEEAFHVQCLEENWSRMAVRLGE